MQLHAQMLHGIASGYHQLIERIVGQEAAFLHALPQPVQIAQGWRQCLADDSDLPFFEFVFFHCREIIRRAAGKGKLGCG
jgi:hypothetical protein